MEITITIRQGDSSLSIALGKAGIAVRQRSTGPETTLPTNDFSAEDWNKLIAALAALSPTAA